MGFVSVIGPCYQCKKLFSYNPHFVPSLTVNGTKEPFCKECIDAANPVRVQNGLPKIVPHPQAYEALPEEEL